MNHAIILAGGAGTRFWPLSRQNNPKQFLSLCSDKSLIELTLKRAMYLVPKENINLTTNKLYREKINRLLKKAELSTARVLFEPEAKNTLAPIALVSSLIYKKDKDAVILVLPSDHFIKDEQKFSKILKRAIGLAEKGNIITLGIKPDRPETGYGYIKASGLRVDKFIEKPNLKTAEKFIKDKRYFWNGGIFIFRADSMLEEIKKFLPKDFKLLNTVRNIKNVDKAWKKFSFTSIDYGIMEKSSKLLLVPCDCGWSDVGSWQAVEEFYRKDKSGNILRGNCLDLGSKNIFCLGQHRLLATIGLENLIIVDTADALLVCTKNRAQEVKKLVEILKERKLKEKI